jgi:hypothetical protein
MRSLIALALLGLAAGTAQGEALERCDLIDTRAAPGLAPAEEFAVRRAADGTILAITLRTLQGQTSVSELTALRPGVSFRHAVLPAGPGQRLAVFNLVTVMPDATIRAETWVRVVDRDHDAPRYVVTRLRCPG